MLLVAGLCLHLIIILYLFSGCSCNIAPFLSDKTVIPYFKINFLALIASATWGSSYYFSELTHSKLCDSTISSHFVLSNFLKARRRRKTAFWVCWLKPNSRLENLTTAPWTAAIGCSNMTLLLMFVYCVFRYRQTLPVVFVAERLAFESVTQFVEFAAPFSLTYSGEGATLLDCKTSMAAIGTLWGEP